MYIYDVQISLIWRKKVIKIMDFKNLIDANGHAEIRGMMDVIEEFDV